MPEQLRLWLGVYRHLSNRREDQRDNGPMAPFVVENRTGAATNIATEAVVRAPADGYTLFFVTAANAINATLYDKLNFSFIRDIAPVATMYYVPNVMAMGNLDGITFPPVDWKAAVCMAVGIFFWTPEELLGGIPDRRL